MVQLSLYLLILSSLSGWLLYVHKRQQLGSLPRAYQAAMEQQRILRRELGEAQTLANQRLQQNLRLSKHITRLTGSLKSAEASILGFPAPYTVTTERPKPNEL